MSTLKVNTLQTAAGVEVYTAKAWVNFNGTGTVAIRASGNVSSITDNGTGDYTVNFTNAMPDANYSTHSLGRRTSGLCISGIVAAGTYSTSAVQINCFNTGGSSNDADIVCVSIFR